MCGYTQHHQRLENVLAQLKNTEDALLCPSGYQANVALLSALGDADTVIFSDALNHASIIDGCRLSRAKIVVYNHKDVADLEAKLRDFPAKKQVVVTDEVFSMDGDHAPLQTLAELKERFGFIWVTDSAHSTLVCGPNGGGLSEALGVQAQIDFQVGTLSKAIGSHGGFVATSTKRRKWLLNTGRAFIFSTSLPLPIVMAAHNGIQTATQTSQIRERLWHNVRRFAKHLNQPANGPIFPVIVGSENKALNLSHSMMAQGFHVPAIRPPTVSPGTCRLRVTLSASHEPSTIDALASALKTGLGKL